MRTSIFIQRDSCVALGGCNFFSKRGQWETLDVHSPRFISTRINHPCDRIPQKRQHQFVPVLNYQRTKHCMKTTILYVAYKKNKSYSLDSVLHFCICHSWRSKPHQLCHYVTAYLARLPPFGSVFTFGAGVLGSVLFSASLARFFSAALMWLINGLGWATNRIANSSYKRNSFIQMQHQSIIYI